ncbi:MAG: OmpH family outer membrane protein [Planctomycetes bacterium]|nr:OmpH family outer membrane protein [Planctomycetota bacterium]
MKNRERIAIYAVLAILLTFNLSSILGLTSTKAVAEGFIVKQDLGPVSALTLTGDDQPLVLHNGKGRLAWSDNAHSKAYSVAFVSTNKAMGQLLESEVYAGPLKSLDEEFTARNKEFEQSLNAYRQQNQNVRPEDPKYREIQQIYTAMREEYQRWASEARGKMEQLETSQIELAFRELVLGVEVVAERLNIDIVYQFVATADDFATSNPARATLAIRERSALVYPEQLDITDAVLEELSLVSD